MSKGKIDVVFNVTSYGSDPKVLMRAMLRKEGSNAKGASNAGTLVLKPRHEIKKFETFQLIPANYKKLDELDQAANEAKGNIKLVIENVPAEFIHSTRQSDGSEYDAVLVNLGTEKAPHMRVFYLSDMQSELLQKGFKPKYKFGSNSKKIKYIIIKIFKMLMFFIIKFAIKCLFDN